MHAASLINVSRSLLGHSLDDLRRQLERERQQRPEVPELPEFGEPMISDFPLPRIHANGELPVPNPYGYRNLSAEIMAQASPPTARVAEIQQKLDELTR